MTFNMDVDRYEDRGGDIGKILHDFEFESRDKNAEEIEKIKHSCNFIIEDLLDICSVVNQYPKLLKNWDIKKSEDINVIQSINKFIEDTGYDFSVLYHLDSREFKKIKKPKDENDINFNGYKFICYVRSQLISDGIEERGCELELERVVRIYNEINLRSSTLDNLLIRLLYEYILGEINAAKKQSNIFLVLTLFALVLINLFYIDSLGVLGVSILATLYLLPKIFAEYAVANLRIYNEKSYVSLLDDFASLKKVNIKINPRINRILSLLANKVIN
jgi:hypothetical protein